MQHQQQFQFKFKRSLGEARQLCTTNPEASSASQCSLEGAIQEAAGKVCHAFGTCTVRASATDIGQLSGFQHQGSPIVQWSLRMAAF